MQATAEGKQVGTLLKFNLFSTPVDFRDIADAAHVLDRQGHEGFAQGQARVGRLARQLGACRYSEITLEGMLAAIHQHLVDAPVAAIRIDIATDLQVIRIHQQAPLHGAAQQLRTRRHAHLLRLAIRLGHVHTLFVLFRIGNHQDGADDGLFAHRIGGDAVDGFLAEFHPFLDRFLNHQQRQADQQHQAKYDQRFD